MRTYLEKCSLTSLATSLLKILIDRLEWRGSLVGYCDVFYQLFLDGLRVRTLSAIFFYKYTIPKSDV